MTKLIKKEFTKGDFVAVQAIKDLIKEDNDILIKIVEGVLKDTTSEETIQLIKTRIFGKTAQYGYTEETNQSFMIIHTMDILNALVLHLTCFEDIAKVQEQAKAIENDMKKLGGAIDTMTTAIANVFLDPILTDKFMKTLQQLLIQLFNDVDRNETLLEQRYVSLHSKNMTFMDNIFATVKTSIVSILTKDDPGIQLDLAQDIFPDYVSHILIADTLFGGVHIMEIGG